MRALLLSPPIYEKLSEICTDIAQICVGSIAIPFIVGDFSWLPVIAGSLGAITFWSLSIWLIIKNEETNE